MKQQSRMLRKLSLLTPPGTVQHGALGQGRGPGEAQDRAALREARGQHPAG